jgi:hypothetical protein
MRKSVNVFVLCGTAAALQAALPVAAPADEAGEVPPEGPLEAPESAAEPPGPQRDGWHGWVASLAITGGATFQNQDGSGESFLFEDGSPTPVTLQAAVDGDDLVVAPFVGASLEMMAPALPVPTNPRFFVSGEVLPSFGSTRTLAVRGDPGCIRGPEVGAPCAKDEQPGERRVSPGAFGENFAIGQGTVVNSEVGLLVFGANAGVSFPLQFAGRQLRIKPSAGWIRWEVEGSGLVSDAACSPVTRCTDVYAANWMPGDPPVQTGFLRETTLTGSASEWFDGIGPGLDVEVDTGVFGPIGTALFVGARAYAVLGERTISFSATESFSDVLGNDVATADFEVEVDPWLYRAHVGIRLQWLGLD